MKILTRSLPVAAAALAVMCASAAQADINRITIGSNRQGSVFFLLASGFAKHIQQNLKIRTTAQPHAGSSVYLPLVDKGVVADAVRGIMRRYPPDQFFYDIHTWPDCFDAFRDLRQFIQERGGEVGWSPHTHDGDSDVSYSVREYNEYMSTIKAQ